MREPCHGGFAPLDAIGTYWATPSRPSPTVAEIPQALADSTAIAMAHVQLLAKLETLVAERTEALAECMRQLEESERRRKLLAIEAMHAEGRACAVLAELIHDDALQYVLPARQEQAEAGEGDTGGIPRANCNLDAAQHRVRGFVSERSPVAVHASDLNDTMATVLQTFAAARGWTVVQQLSEATRTVYGQLVIHAARELLTSVGPSKHTRARARCDLPLRDVRGHPERRSLPTAGTARRTAESRRQVRRRSLSPRRAAGHAREKADPDNRDTRAPGQNYRPRHRMAGRGRGRGPLTNRSSSRLRRRGSGASPAPLYRRRPCSAARRDRPVIDPGACRGIDGLASISWTPRVGSRGPGARRATGRAPAAGLPTSSASPQRDDRKRMPSSPAPVSCLRLGGDDRADWRRPAADRDSDAEGGARAARARAVLPLDRRPGRPRGSGSAVGRRARRARRPGRRSSPGIARRSTGPAATSTASCSTQPRREGAAERARPRALGARASARRSSTCATASR